MAVIYLEGKSGDRERPSAEKIADAFGVLKYLIDAFLPYIQSAAKIPYVALSAHTVHKVKGSAYRWNEKQKVLLPDL